MYIKSILLAASIALFMGCNGGNSSEGYASEAAMDKVAIHNVAETSQAETTTSVIERKLIKDGRVEFETDNLETTRNTIYEAIKTYKAYVASDQAYNYPGRMSQTISVRMPAEHFDTFLADATTGVTKFDSKDINIRDVTEEFLDVEARLKTKKELEARYLELLKKAQNVKDILEIERELGQLRSDIESVEGRLKYLENQVAMSTLNITFYKTVDTETEFGKKFQNGFKNGWENLIWFFVGLVNLWPFILFGLIAVTIILVMRKRKKNRG
ncbi:MAG TPA: DUF4349 domain-containing protein [Flavobacteriaceae bacterium]|nr:DUF4349 domain-containing protein [Flavobacteriaceae bacterium]